MIRGRLIRRAMVLAPKTLLGQWVKELTLCGLGSRVFEYYGTSSADRCAESQPTNYLYVSSMGGEMSAILKKAPICQFAL